AFSRLACLLSARRRRTVSTRKRRRADTPRARGGPEARVGDDRLPYPERIKDYERKLEALAQEHYPETMLLRQVRGVGPLTALTFVLTLEDPKRFQKSRAVGAYLGLAPAKNQSGERDLQQRISKEGDEMLRRLLVGSAHYILGPFGEDSDLRRHGEKIAQRGGKSAKKRAVVALARKLSVLLHHLWISGEAYEPLYNAQRLEEEKGGQEVA
ncbi:MAG: transposase, partial [Actinobacteria bacterium]|nr:transposase [Actinomycetota bacterium]